MVVRGNAAPYAVKSALDGEATTSASFTRRANNIHELIMETCDQDIATMSLAVDLFNRNANATVSPRICKKRNFLLEEISLLLGGILFGRPGNYRLASGRINNP